jgi:hypothetical protein
MISTEQGKNFEEVTKPVIEWLNNNGNPHLSVIITTDSAELVSGEYQYFTSEFIKD